MKNVTGPKCVVVGPTDSGKSTLCKILLNYAVKHSWTPYYVDLDLGQGIMSPPGCLSSAMIMDYISMNEYFNLEKAKVMFHGMLSPGDSHRYLDLQLEQIAKMVEYL